MRVVVVIIIIVFYSAGYGQQFKIAEVLNGALNTENKLQRLKPTNNYKISWHQGYKIKDSLLYIHFTKTDTLSKCSCTVYRTVKLNKINAVAKDINVVFLTQPGAVKEILTYNKCGADTDTLTTETHYRALFFTEIKTAKNNDDLAIRLQQAFAESGLQINIAYWYD